MAKFCVTFTDPDSREEHNFHVKADGREAAVEKAKAKAAGVFQRWYRRGAELSAAPVTVTEGW